MKQLKQQAPTLQVAPIDITPIRNLQESQKQKAISTKSEKYLIFKNAILRGFFTKSIFDQISGPFYGTLATGDFIIGKLKKSKLEGKGLVILANSGLIFGRFKQGRLDGDAVVKFGNGDLIAGRFKYGIMHGDYIYFECKTKSLMKKTFFFGEEKSSVTMKYEGFGPGYEEYKQVCDPEELILGGFLEENNFIHCELMECGNLFIGSEDLKFGFSMSNEYLIHATGFFELDNLEGYGRLYKHNDLIIEGYFKDGNIHGKAILYSIQKEKYTLSHYDFGFERVIIKQGTSPSFIPLSRFYSIEVQNLGISFEEYDYTFQTDFCYFPKNHDFFTKNQGFGFPFDVDEIYSLETFLTRKGAREYIKRQKLDLMEVIREDSREDFTSRLHTTERDLEKEKENEMIQRIFGQKDNSQFMSFYWCDYGTGKDHVSYSNMKGQVEVKLEE